MNILRWLLSQDVSSGFTILTDVGMREIEQRKAIEEASGCAVQLKVRICHSLQTSRPRRKPPKYVADNVGLLKA